jgi:hypothetical protein
VPATNAPSVAVFVNKKAMAAQRTSQIRSIEIEAGVHAQSALKMKIALGQENSGDWAGYLEQEFQPMSLLTVDAQLGGRSVRLINGFLTQVRMNFTADPCSSEIELTALDALEKLKRHAAPRQFKNQSLTQIVGAVFDDGKITAPARVVPDTGSANSTRDVPMQAQDDLTYLRALGDRVNAEVSVDPSGFDSQGNFATLDLGNAPTVDTVLVVNQGKYTNVQNAQFYYELTGPTAVEADFVGPDGKKGDTVRANLRDIVGSKDKTLLGPPGFENVKRLERSGMERQDDLQRRCTAELDRLAWLVVGKGDLDTAVFGDILQVRRAVKVAGASGSFSGPYLVWKVAHSITRERYCQKFELRRKLGT